MASASIHMTVTIDRDAQAILKQIAVYSRAVALDKALKTIGRKVVNKAKRLVPQPGSPGYTKRYGARKDRKHLRDTITSTVRDYQDRYKVLIVGPAYPAGASGHLVEHGHRVAMRGTGTLKRIQTKGGKLQRPPRSKLGPGFQGTGVLHSWVQGREFLKPATDEVQPQVQQILLDELRKAVP